MHQNIPKHHPIWITHPIWIDQQNPGNKTPGFCIRGFYLYLRVLENHPNAKVTLLARGGSGAKAPPLAVRRV